MIRVLLVDDDPLVRSALALLLGGREDVVVVGQATDGQDGVDRARALRPDVVLMDIRMPHLNGLEATRILLREPDPPRVIVLTTFDADEYVLGAVAAGADGFLLKDSAPEEIVGAIVKVANGEAMLSPSATRTLVNRMRSDFGDTKQHDARAMLATLTEREHDVALAVGRGLSNADIARELFLSVPTVKAHISRLFDKLGATNRVQIAIIVHDAGLA